MFTKFLIIANIFLNVEFSCYTTHNACVVLVLNLNLCDFNKFYSTMKATFTFCCLYLVHQLCLQCCLKRSLNPSEVRCHRLKLRVSFVCLILFNFVFPYDDLYSVFSFSFMCVELVGNVTVKSRSSRCSFKVHLISLIFAFIIFIIQSIIRVRMWIGTE